jgi:hypothetical protein
MPRRRNEDLEPSGEDLPTTSRRPPATTPELREQELVALAFDLVEERLRKGTATSQETVHFLKLGSENAKLERDMLRLGAMEKESKIEQMNRSDRIEALFEDAIKAFKGYAGEEPTDDEQQYF